MGRREYLKAIHDRYRRSTDEQKGTILDEFCKVCGYHRKHAIRLLSGPRPEAHPRRAAPGARAMVGRSSRRWPSSGKRPATPGRCA